MRPQCWATLHGLSAKNKWWAHWDSNPEPRDSSLRVFRHSLDYVFTRVCRVATGREGDGGWRGD